MNNDEVRNYIENLYPNPRLSSHNSGSPRGESIGADLETFQRFVSNIPPSATGRDQEVGAGWIADNIHSSYVREAGRNLANRIDERLINRVLRESNDDSVRGFNPTLPYLDDSDNMFTNLNIPTNPPPVRSRNTENLSDYGFSHNLFTDCSSADGISPPLGSAPCNGVIPNPKTKESKELLELVSDNQELEKLNVLLYNALEFAFGFDNSDSLELALKNDELFSKLWE